MTWLTVPRDLVARPGSRPLLRQGRAGVLSGRRTPLRRRNAPPGGILVLGSAMVIWGLALPVRPAVRHRGRLLQPERGIAVERRRVAAWCDLREIMPYAFGYMMSAKVGTGLVAEIGAMRSRTRSTRSGDGHRLAERSSAPRGCWAPGWCCPPCTSVRWAPVSSPLSWRSCSRSARCPRAVSS